MQNNQIKWSQFQNYFFFNRILFSVIFFFFCTVFYIRFKQHKSIIPDSTFCRKDKTVRNFQISFLTSVRSQTKNYLWQEKWNIITVQGNENAHNLWFNYTMTIYKKWHRKFINSSSERTFPANITVINLSEQMKCQFNQSYRDYQIQSICTTTLK